MNGIEIQAVDRGFADTNGHAHIMAIILNSLPRYIAVQQDFVDTTGVISSLYHRTSMSPHHLTSLWCDSSTIGTVPQFFRWSVHRIF
jgi:hypothetical protein